MRAFIIVDLGFGDAGKGLLTDFLVRRTGAKMVVRYNGAAQAGHNVVTPDGRHHTFSQFGSGTFVPGVRTFLSGDVIVHPTALFHEEARLRTAGVTDALERLRVSASARVTTPWHQALNRLRELSRGAARHGSCGAGVGETVAHAELHPDDVVRARDVADTARLHRKLRRIRDYARTEVERLELDPRALAQEPARMELEILDSAEVLGRWIDGARGLAPLLAEEGAWVPSDESPAVVFEGAQGVLLDERHGFHPHTTWSTCTSAPALRLLSAFAPDAAVCRIGVLRTYAVRHGPGPFPTDTPELPETPPEHNAFNAWQGDVRRGWFDGALARYAVEANGGIDTLAITHLDWLSRISRWTYCASYQSGPELPSQLASARPVLHHCPANEDAVLETIERIVGRRVTIGSRGPSAADVFTRHERGLSTVEVERGTDRYREVGRPERPACVALSEHRAVHHDPGHRE